MHGLKAVHLKNVALAVAPRASVSKIYKNSANSNDQRTRNGVSDGFMIMRAQQGILIRGAEVAEMAFWHDSGSSRHKS
eukprot:8120413-Pyramimonas_sp.AAC.1